MVLHFTLVEAVVVLVLLEIQEIIQNHLLLEVLVVLAEQMFMHMDQQIQ
tara:strand:+ start:324 stop:470 length:147 start_codon:yes stop_codon:yes gene_type:complete